MVTSFSRGNPNGLKGKKNSQQDYLHTGTVCPERLQNLHPWRFLFFVCLRQTNLEQPALIFGTAVRGTRAWASQPRKSLPPKLSDSSACVKQSRRVPARLLLCMWWIQAATTEAMSPKAFLFLDKIAANFKCDTQEKMLEKGNKKMEKLV